MHQSAQPVVWLVLLSLLSTEHSTDADCRQNHAAAVESFEEASAFPQADAALFFRLGNSLFGLDLLTQAENAYRRALAVALSLTGVAANVNRCFVDVLKSPLLQHHRAIVSCRRFLVEISTFIIQKWGKMDY